MQILRTDYRGRGKFRSVADGLNRIGRVVNEMFGENGIEIEDRGGRVVVRNGGSGGGPGFPWTKLSFGYRLVQDNESVWHVRIYPGAIRVHGVAVYTLTANPLLDNAGAEVALAGTNPWVYVEVARGAATGSSVGAGVSSNEPLSTTTTLRIPLYRFTQEGERYGLAQICNMGDINLDTPLL